MGGRFGCGANMPALQARIEGMDFGVCIGFLRIFIPIREGDAGSTEAYRIKVLYRILLLFRAHSRYRSDRILFANPVQALLQRSKIEQRVPPYPNPVKPEPKRAL